MALRLLERQYLPQMVLMDNYNIRRSAVIWIHMAIGPCKYLYRLVQLVGILILQNLKSIRIWGAKHVYKCEYDIDAAGPY